jgi:hypothetical protein
MIKFISILIRFFQYKEDEYEIYNLNEYLLLFLRVIFKQRQQQRQQQQHSNMMCLL